MFQSHWKVLHSNFSWPQIFYLVNKYILPFPKGKNPSRKTRNGEWNFVFRKYLIIYKGNTSHAPGKGTLFWPVVKNLLAHISSSYFLLALFIPSYLRKLIMHLKWFWVKWVGSMAQWCIFWEELKTNFEEVIFNLLFWVPPPGPAQMWYQKKAVFFFLLASSTRIPFISTYAIPLPFWYTESCYSVHNLLNIQCQYLGSTKERGDILTVASATGTRWDLLGSLSS